MPKIARSPQQEYLLSQLMDGRCITSPALGLKGRAKSYSGRYQAAFEGFIDRLIRSGHLILKVPGPRGGVMPTHYSLASMPTDNLCGWCKSRIPEIVIMEAMNE